MPDRQTEGRGPVAGDRWGSGWLQGAESEAKTRLLGARHARPLTRSRGPCGIWTGWKCGVSGPTPTPPKPSLHFSKIPGQVNGGVNEK